MEMVDPDFPKKVQEGDFIIAGTNIGYGHDHPTGPQAIKGCGVSAIICESTNRNFYRNSIHIGLPIIMLPGIKQHVKTGDQLEIDLKEGTIANQRTGKVITFSPYPDFIMEILEAGGIYPLTKKRIDQG